MKLERRLPPFYALFFYAFPAIVAWIWLYHAHPGRSAELWSFEKALLGIPIGLAAGLGVVGLTLLASRTCAWARKLESEFGWILGAQKLWGIIWIALLSGFAEEYLFRGALQEKFGIWVATAAFAIIHWPINRNFLPWPFIALIIGLGLGGLREWTDSLWAPAVAHATINFVNLLRITRRFRNWDEPNVVTYVERGAQA